MATITETEPSPSYKLELMTAYGPVYRDVLRTAPRDCDPSEVPVIDLSGIYGDFESRKALAAVVREAAENTGFFYIQNAGIPKEVIDAAYGQAKNLFAQPEEKKRAVSTAHSKWFNGWTEKHGSHLSPSETRDYREGFGWRYDPKYDPDPKDLDAVPEDIKPWIRGEDFVWEKTSHIPGFKRDMIAYWQECLKLARRMIRIFALALDLPENYFDDIVTYPGADGVLNYCRSFLSPVHPSGSKFRPRLTHTRPQERGCGRCLHRRRPGRAHGPAVLHLPLAGLGGRPAGPHQGGTVDQGAANRRHVRGEHWRLPSEAVQRPLQVDRAPGLQPRAR